MLIDTTDGPRVYRVGVEDGLAWLTDDILLGKIEALTVVDDDYVPEDEDLIGYPIGAGKVLLGKLWPENQNDIIRIPYVMGPNCTTEQVDYAIDGFDHWEERTDGYVDFVMYAWPYQGNPNDNRIFVNCTFDVACSVNFVGMYPVAPFNIIHLRNCVDPWSAWQTDTSMYHEIGHVMGFFHEHQRQDRDNHVTHFDQATHSDWNFDLYNPNVGQDIGPFNFRSMMLYNCCNLNNDQDDCWDYHDGTMFGEPGFDEEEDYVTPSMLRAGYTDPCHYPCGGVFWGEGDRLVDYPNEDNGGDLYTFARLYKKTWHISNDGNGILAPLHFRTGWGSGVSTRNLKVGKFCDDDMSNRPNNDDILWHHQANDNWYVICDGGWHSWEHGEGTVVLTNSDMEEVLIADFDGYEQTSDGDERFSDILRNEPISREWQWLLNGELNSGWSFVPISGPPRTDEVEDLKIGTFCFNSMEAGISDVLRKNPDGAQWQVSCGAVADWVDLGVSYGDLDQVLIADVNTDVGDVYSDILRNNVSGLLELAIATPAPAPPNGLDSLCTYSGFTQLSIHPSSENTDTDTMKWFAPWFGAGHFYNDLYNDPDGTDLLYRIDESLDEWWVAESRFLESHYLFWRQMNDFTSSEYPDTPMIWGAAGFSSRPNLLIGRFTTETSVGVVDDEDFDDVVTTLPSVKQGEI